MVNVMKRAQARAMTFPAGNSTLGLLTALPNRGGIPFAALGRTYFDAKWDGTGPSCFPL